MVMNGTLGHLNNALRRYELVPLNEHYGMRRWRGTTRITWNDIHRMGAEHYAGFAMPTNAGAFHG